MRLSKSVVEVTTAAGGGFTGYTGVINGAVRQIHYTYGDMLSGADLEVYGETTEIYALTKTNLGAGTVTYSPAAQAQKVADGAVLTNTGFPPVFADERLVVVIADGGNVKSGTVTVIVEGTVDGA